MAISDYAARPGGRIKSGMAISDAALVAGNVLRAGIQFHQRGDLANAEGCYHSALQMVPEHPYALNLLGLAAYQRGRFEEGARLARRAIAIYAKDAKFHVNLGNCLRLLGDSGEAQAAYRRALVLQPGDGRAIDLGGFVMHVKATAADTDGAFTLLEAAEPPHFGPPMHIHRDAAEAFYVLEGEYLIFVDDREIRCPAGSFIYIPAGVVHGFRVGDVPSRKLNLYVPAAIPLRNVFGRPCRKAM